jgi:hypothetical protein
VAPAGTPEPVAAEAREWLHRLAQRLPLTDPPTPTLLWHMPRRLQREELPIPQAVIAHFGTPDGFLQSVPGLQQHAGFLVLQSELHTALLAAAAAAAP